MQKTVSGKITSLYSIISPIKTPLIKFPSVDLFVDNNLNKSPLNNSRISNR